jgi:hypothetical protein
MMDRAVLLDEFIFDSLGEKRANVLAALMLDDSHGPIGVGEEQVAWVGRLRTDRQALRSELAAFVSAFFGEGHRGKGFWIIGAVEVLVDVKSIKSGVKRAESGSKTESLLGLLP